MRLETLTPLFIGGQESLIKYNYTIKPEESKAVILQKDLVSLLIEKGLNADLIKELVYDNHEILSLEEVIKRIEENNIENKNEILKEIEKNMEIINVKSFPREESKKIEIALFNNFYLNNKYNFYIPGSSIKGTLRTYVIFKMLLELNNKFGNAFDYLAKRVKDELPNLRKRRKQAQLEDVINYIKDNIKNKRVIYWLFLLEFSLDLIESFLSGKKTSNYWINIEDIINGRSARNYIVKNINKILRKYNLTINDINFKDFEELEKYLRKNKELYGAFHSKNFIIRDSRVLNLKDFSIIEIRRVKGKSSQGIPIIMLALDKNKEIEIEIKMKKELKEFLGNSLKKVNEMVISKIFFLNDDLSKKLKDYNKNSYLINIGRFSGASVKSFLALLIHNYPVTFNLTPDKEMLGWCLIDF